ncbi:hypothetical protein AGMMS49940_13840 [Spirochaetia bacterium]|nr:hypothetical protein AGMMS49940_13840 [Spirochaetia bacterium]
MKKAGDLLASFFDERVLKTARGYSELFSSWQSIAGDNIAAHSRIRELEHSVLLVEADHPGWIQILQTREKGLLDALRRRFPEQNITGISFRLSRERTDLPTDLSAAAEQGITGDVDNSDTVYHNIETNNVGSNPYEKIKDEHFREALRRLEESIVIRSKGGSV